jgi:hypothetical protein
VGRGGRVDVPEKPDSRHIGTISITARVRRGGWNAMKPRIQGGRIQLVVATVS